jgi:hypothetical protein
MSREESFLITLVITVASSVLVILYLHRPLHRILCELLGANDRAGFGAAFAHVLLILVPVACAVFGRADAGRETSPFFVILEQLKWSLVGLIGTTFVVGLCVAAFIPPGHPVDQMQSAELNQLLAKVKEWRGKEASEQREAPGAGRG